MVAATSPAPSRLALYLDLIRWSRPAGWLLLLWPSLAALWVAAGGFPGWHLLAVFVLGVLHVSRNTFEVLRARYEPLGPDEPHEVVVQPGCASRLDG